MTLRTWRVGLFVLALLLVFEGFFGPDFAPKNLTTLFVWVHYRGLVVIAALLLGNLFCAGCPFVFARNLARRLWTPRWRLPNRLRNKWPAVILFVGILFCYERFSLWSSPSATAVLIVGFFAAILLVDLLFKEASFCKFICPLGQFNFLSSLISPRDVRAKDLSICRSCESLACLKGSTTSRGCELKLFVPKKRNGFNCTMCMDCKTACPHDNVILAPVTPGESLFDGQRVWRRPDMVALQIVFIFGAILNAFAMVGPAYALTGYIASRTGVHSESFVLVMLFALFLFVAPTMIWFASGRARSQALMVLPAFIPLGFGIWAAHYSFHFFTGPLTFLPVLWSRLPLPDVTPTVWAKVPMGFQAATIIPLQLGLLFLGLVVTMTTIRKRKVKSVWPWYIVSLSLAGFSAWILTLPMEMRGTFVGG